MKKKNYIIPTISLVVSEDLCDTGLKTGSVFQQDASSQTWIDQFEIVEESQTKQDFSGLWTESGKENWGDD